MADTREVIQRVFDDIINNHDVDAADELFAEDFVDHGLDTQRTGRIFGWLFIATPLGLRGQDSLRGGTWRQLGRHAFVPGDLSDTSLKLGAILDFLLIGGAHHRGL